MNPYCEKVIMPDDKFKINSFISPAFEYILEVHPHWHDEVEILYVLNGQAMQQVNDQFFTIAQGDLVIINSGQLHSTYSIQGSNCEIFVLLFDASNILERFTSHEKQAALCSFSNYVKFQNPLSITNEPAKQIVDCIFQINEELNLKLKAYEHQVKSLLYKMLVILERNNLYKICPNNDKKNQVKRQMLEKTFELIDISYSEVITLTKAAAASNLSIQHFCRLFKQTTGMTFYEYLSFYRVNIAEKLLGSQKKITEIAIECGFGSISSFIRNFKKYKYCTPTEYKNL